MLILFLYPSLHAQPCPVIPKTKQTLVSRQTLNAKEWITTQKMSEIGHLVIDSKDNLPTTTTIRSSSSDVQDGYLIQVHDSYVQVFRKGTFKNIPISRREPLPPKESFSMHIMQNQAAMELWICNKDTSVAHIRWEDNAFSDGFMSIEHQKSLQQTQVFFQSKSSIMPAHWPQNILHSSVLLHVEGEHLPPLIEKGRIVNPLEPGVWSLMDRSSLPSILPYKDTISSISSSVPYWATNTDDKHLPPTKQEEELIRLAQKYEVRMHQLGNSRQGRSIWAIQLTNDSRHRPSVLFFGGVSGNDVQSIQKTFDQLYRFLETHDGLIELWKKKLDLWFIPTLNIDGNHYYWYRSTHDGEVFPVDINQDGTIEIGEGVRGHQYSTPQHREKTRESILEVTPEIQALTSLNDRIAPSLLVSWDSNVTSIQEEMFQRFGTYSLNLSAEDFSHKKIESELNHLLAGPAIRIMTADEHNHPIQSNITVHKSKHVWKTKQDGLWVHPVSRHKPYTITISAPSYQEQTIRIQTNRLYRIQLIPVH